MNLITLAEAKKHLNIESSFIDDDSYINSLIEVSFLSVKNYCNNQTWIDETSTGNISDGGNPEFLNSCFVDFTYSGSTITQINYWSDSTKTLKLYTKYITYVGDNATTTVIEDEQTGNIYTTNVTYSGSTIISVTKTTSNNTGSVIYTSDYLSFADITVSGTTIPLPVKHATLLMVGNLYANRESVSFGNPVVIPFTISFLLAPYINYSN